MEPPRRRERGFGDAPPPSSSDECGERVDEMSNECDRRPAEILTEVSGTSRLQALTYARSLLSKLDERERHARTGDSTGLTDTERDELPGPLLESIDVERF